LSHAERGAFAGQRHQRGQPALDVNTADAAIDAAKTGLGIVRVLFYQAEASLADGSLRMILEDFEPEAIPVNLLHREDRLPQAKVQSFIALAAPRLRAELKAQAARSG
jgi:DNA-binding transcriptional LysR family regulator